MKIKKWASVGKKRKPIGNTPFFHKSELPAFAIDTICRILDANRREKCKKNNNWVNSNCRCRFQDLKSWTFGNQVSYLIFGDFSFFPQISV